MSTRWQVHLSAEASAVLRDSTRSAGARIAEALDDLAQRGPAAVDVEQRGHEWSGRVVAGDHVLVVAGRNNDERILIVRVVLADEHRAHRTVDMLPLPINTRRTLGSVIQGLDLDLRYTLRALRRAPLFTAVVVATLAIGFGGSTALLDVMHTVYGAALPFGEGDRLMRIRNSNTSPSGDVRRYNLSPADFHLVRSNTKTFSDVVAMGGRAIALLGDGPAEHVGTIGVSPNWLQVLRMRPILGRGFTAEEEQAGSDANVALISHALWQRRFGGSRDAIGSTLRYDGGVLTVIGVLAPGINYPYDADIWTPLTLSPSDARTNSLNVVARLVDDASLASAQTDAARLQAERRAANLPTVANGFDVNTLRNDFIRDDARTLRALSAAVLCLLVLAFVNVANLLVARFTARRAELGLRAALGGRRDQQIRQMLLEAVLLFATGLIGGLLLANWLRGLLTITIPSVFRNQLGVETGDVGVGVTLTSLAIGLACALGVGIVAALRAAKTDPMTLLRQGGRGSVGRGDRRVFDVLVAAQLSLSLVLLVGASLLIGRFRAMSAAHPGYEVDGVSTMRITIEHERYRAADARLRLTSALEERIGAVPGVESVGITTVNPLCCGDWGAPIEVEGRPIAPNQAPTLVAHSYVTPGYFATMRIPISRGSAYERTDRPGGPLTVVIDQEFAHMAWPGQDPLGKRVRLARQGQEWRTVVGVVPVTEHQAEMRAAWFLPYYQDPTGPSTEQLHVMARAAAGVTTESLREVVRQIDPTLAVYEATTMNALRSGRRSQDRLGAIVSGVFAMFGLLLAGFSLYGLLSYSVELRVSEMGLRIALGANRGAIVSLVFRQAATRLAAGITLGLGLALAVNQILRGSINGLGWVPWQTLAALTGLMALVTAAAAIIPALRATRVDPIRALRGN